MILIIGANGQLARSLAEQNWERDVRILGSKDLDLARPSQLRRILDEQFTESPSLIFNAAAYTAVDKAETEKELALRINADAVGEIGKWAHEHETPIIHFSTDYVYSGEGETPYSENDPIGPTNHYGQSKWKGEEELRSVGGSHFIFRISWVVSPFGNNFVKTILRLGSERKELKIVADQVGSPMSALAISRLMHRCFANSSRESLKAKSGTYNISSAPFCSWHDFAKEIIREGRAQQFSLSVENIIPIPSEEFPTPARRPKNSRLSDALLQKTFGDQLGSWNAHLPEIIRRLK